MTTHQHQRIAPCRRRAVLPVLGAVACTVALLVGATPSAATPSTVAPVGRAAAPVAADPLALPLRPAGSAYARQLLQRLADSGAEPADADVITVGAALDAGASAAGLAALGLRSDAVLNARLGAIYQQVLGRPADSGGRDYYRTLIRAGGASLEDVLVALSTSPEARAQTDGSDSAFVAGLYQHLLGRAGDGPGITYWVGRLHPTAIGGVSARTAVARAFVRSLERARTVVGEAYIRDLRRAADAGGREAYAGTYAAGSLGEVEVDALLLGSAESRGFGCDGTDPRTCLLPFPNDAYTVPDATTATGRRVSFKPEWMPRNVNGKAVDPREWNRNDGYSPGQAAITVVPGIDLAATGAAPVTDVGASLDADAPIVVVDADSGERMPYFAELDAGVTTGQGPLLIVRPAVDYQAGHRYVIGLRNLKDAGGATLAAPARFAAYRDDAGGVALGAFEDRRPQMESIISILTSAGVVRSSLYNAWDFTIASTANITGRLQSIRDRSLAALGSSAPAFSVTTVTDNPASGVARRVEGTFDVPRYLTGDGSAGNGFQNGADGLPVQTGTYQARFDCELPSAVDTPARAVVYGHGLFGSYREVRSGPQRAMVGGHNMAYCGTDWIGMSEDDVGNAATIVSDLSTFRTLTDRSQQGILNTIFLGRLLTTPTGFVSNPAFRRGGEGDGTTKPMIDTGHLFYDGNSQGAVIGGAFIAMSPDVEAGALGVAGSNYSLLLDRSVDFDPFRAVLAANYTDTVDHTLGLQLIQMLWDRGETNGYNAHLGTDPLPGTGAKRVLLHVAVGDHQVSTVAAEVEARTAKMAVHRPSHAAGRNLDVDPAWNLPAVEYPSTGSALVYWDSGAALAPVANVPPRTGEDPHQDPRNSAQAQQQKSTFLAAGGTIVDVCSGQPCTAPQS